MVEPADGLRAEVTPVSEKCYRVKIHEQSPHPYFLQGILEKVLSRCGKAMKIEVAAIAPASFDLLISWD